MYTGYNNIKFTLFQVGKVPIFSDAVRGGSFAVSDAYNTYPLAVKLHIADLTATYLLEQGTSEVENGHEKKK